MLVLDRPEEVNRFIDENGGGYRLPGTFTAIGRWVDGKWVGGVTFYDDNGAHIYCNIALLPGYSPRGLLLAVLRYAFDQLALKRLTFLVSSSNLRSIRFCRHFGGILEATLRGADPSGDLLIFALWPDNCPLWSRYGKETKDAESS